ncbi:TetR/AcrR family transcriptional regulator [Pseudonocardia benzenivorans]|jgi:AcrR family transcriptional regulator|uniref:TetR/AcrR family transcriptional regulator n=1 Tax=Pseudonocardia benzenivorans TaxID=228005 RepID=A0ABW3VAY8_9PSEU
MAEPARSRPRRADARRNYDALVAAARDAFAESGTDAPLEDIARRAGVGIATLYRNFPTRADLVESVYVDEVQAVCDAADALAGDPPWEALTGWLHRFAEYVGTKHALIAGLNRESETFPSCRKALYAAGEPLLTRAQEAGLARPDVTIADVVRMVGGVVGVEYDEPGQRERVLGMALDGLRARPR